jgi:hypothetical protein
VVETNQAASPELLFPLLVTGGGYTTEFILFSGAAPTNGALYFFQQNGGTLSLTLN